MANLKTTQLTADTSPRLTDILPGVKDPAGTPVNRKWTLSAILGLGLTRTGTITDHALVVGNGGADVSALASLGTATTVLHGNASADPTFGAVALATDVSGDLPFANLTQIAGLSVLGVAGGSTADVAAITAGTDGHVLTRVSSTSLAFTAPAAPGGGGSPLESQTASGSAALNFTACFSATYDAYRVVFENVRPATNAVGIQIEFSSDGGGSYDTGNNYSWVGFRASKVGSAADGGTAQGKIVLDGVSGVAAIQNTAALGGVCGELLIFHPLSATIYPRVEANMGWDDGTTSQDILVTTSGKHRVATADNAFRVLFTSGNIADGTIRVYGLAKS